LELQIEETSNGPEREQGELPQLLVRPIVKVGYMSHYNVSAASGCGTAFLEK
jgi:hypothetical protein